MKDGKVRVNEISVKTVLTDGDVTGFEFAPKVHNDISKDELDDLFDDAKARVWAFLQTPEKLKVEA